MYSTLCLVSEGRTECSLLCIVISCRTLSGIDGLRTFASAHNNAILITQSRLVSVSTRGGGLVSVCVCFHLRVKMSTASLFSILKLYVLWRSPFCEICPIVSPSAQSLARPIERLSTRAAAPTSRRAWARQRRLGGRAAAGGGPRGRGWRAWRPQNRAPKILNLFRILSEFSD